MQTQFANRDIISINTLSKEDILQILKCAHELKHSPQPSLLTGKVMASCFYEPSTRTRLSFESAMLRMGGQVIGFSDAITTSTAKGESLSDSMKVIGQYADAIVIRHPLDGAAQKAAEATITPVINGGDGTNQHPTQTLLDLFSMQESQGTLEGLKIALVGDLKHGRTVHSLALACAHFKSRLFFVSPESLQLPEYVCHALRSQGVKFSFHASMDEIIEKVDVLYMTRIQEERFVDRMEYERVKHSFHLSLELLESRAKENLRVLHPLPRLSEIGKEVDASHYAYYFQQAQNGLFVRQALLALILGRLT